ncbi:MAG: hypothetical protein MI923_13485 [Phycisphaerales bacterium]|nr:hypothetical protein [Phycisphaerales bacterium]
MVQLCGVCCGLLLFSAMIICGLLSGNAVEVIILRAVGGLFGGLLLGMLTGWVGTLIVEENVDAPEGETTGDDDGAAQSEAVAIEVPAQS